MTNRKIGYIRVSTGDQNHDRQADMLESMCDEVFVEIYSATTAKRPVFQQVLRTLRRGDTLVVLSVDRAFRSTVDAITHAERLCERGITFQILSLAVDTSTADGMLAYSVIAAVAKHERDRISERTKQGLEAARKRGKRLGRPPKLTPSQVMSAIHDIDAGTADADSLAEGFGVHPETLARHLREIQKAMFNPPIN